MRLRYYVTRNMQLYHILKSRSSYLNMNTATHTLISSSVYNTKIFYDWENYINGPVTNNSHEKIKSSKFDSTDFFIFVYINRLELVYEIIQQYLFIN